MKLEHALPEDVGMSSTRLVKAREYAQRVGDQLSSTGGAVLVIRHNKIAGEWYWGKRSAAEDALPYDEDTMTPVASVTKGLTATALALLIQDGIMWLDEPVWTYIPEFQTGDLAKITVRHLATHSSGLPGGDLDFYGCWRDQQPGESLPDTYFRHAMGRTTRGVVFEPGTWHVYSDPAITILGEVIHRASGKRVPEIMQERIFDPLELKRIGWDFDDELAKDIAEIVDGNLAGRAAGQGKPPGRFGGGWSDHQCPRPGCLRTAAFA
jgi:CubicO group peptidase (beta-lactamase class C family)